VVGHPRTASVASTSAGTPTDRVGEGDLVEPAATHDGRAQAAYRDADLAPEGQPEAAPMVAVTAPPPARR
jgi:hypothetical protein